MSGTVIGWVRNGTGSCRQERATIVEATRGSAVEQRAASITYFRPIPGADHEKWSDPDSLHGQQGGCRRGCRCVSARCLPAARCRDWERAGELSDSMDDAGVAPGDDSWREVMQLGQQWRARSAEYLRAWSVAKRVTRRAAKRVGLERLMEERPRSLPHRTYGQHVRRRGHLLAVASAGRWRAILPSILGCVSWCGTPRMTFRLLSLAAPHGGPFAALHVRCRGRLAHGLRTNTGCFLVRGPERRGASRVDRIGCRTGSAAAGADHFEKPDSAPAARSPGRITRRDTGRVRRCLPAAASLGGAGAGVDVEYNKTCDAPGCDTDSGGTRTN